MKKLYVAAMIVGLAILFLVVNKEKTALLAPQEPENPFEEIIKQENKKEEKPKLTVAEAVSKIDRISLKENVEYLASNELEGRMSGKKGNKIAADFIKKRFEKYDLATEYDKFSIKRINPGPKNEIGDDFTQNIYTWIEGNDLVLKDEIVVIGAHMDHIGYGPSYSRYGNNRIHNGADDNASGTAALIEIAEAFAAMKGQNKRTVVIMAFSAEEMGLKGSLHYVNNPKFPKGNPDIKKHVFMLNMDMIGYLGKSKTAVFDDGSSSPDIGFIIKQLSEKYSFAKSVTLRGSGGSDHAPFYNKKIPVAFLHTGLHDYYHTPKDTADRINYDGLEKVTRYGFELAWNVCNAVERVEFDYGSFTEMDYSHDHGQKDMPLEVTP
jgi:hypothetical protein